MEPSAKGAARPRPHSLWHDTIIGRRQGAVPRGAFVRRVCGHGSMVRRYELDGRLEGHHGCVNTVAFNLEGDLAVTGSDDTYLMIWDVASAQRKTLKLSGHSENIFSARFLPFSNNNELVSVAADGEVRWHSLGLAERLGGGSLNPRSSAGSRVLARHEGRAHRLCLLPGASSCFLSCGEDGRVFRFDLREPRKTRLVTLTDEDGDYLPIFALSVDPLRPYHFVVGGSAAAVSLFDARRLPAQACEPASIYAPRHMRRYGRGRGADHVTGVAHSWNGEDIVATYNDECIYRFDISRDAVPDSSAAAAASAASAALASSAQASGAARRPMPEEQVNQFRRVRRRRDEEVDQDGEEEEEEDEEERRVSIMSAIERAGYEQGRQAAMALLARGMEGDGDGGGEDEEGDVDSRGYRMKYEGHRNDRTVKQVNFLGPRSEYVISGSDDGHIFIWTREEGKLVQLLHGDRIGAVNCLETHPNLPLLATSGLENDAKLWRPTAPKAANPAALKGRHDIPATHIMHRNAQARAQAAGVSDFTSMLLRSALRSGDAEQMMLARMLAADVSRMSRVRFGGDSSDEEEESSEDEDGGYGAWGDFPDEEGSRAAFGSSSEDDDGSERSMDASRGSSSDGGGSDSGSSSSDSSSAPSSSDSGSDSEAVAAAGEE